MGNINIYWPHLVMLFWLVMLLLTPSLCQDDSDDTTTAVYIITLRQAPASHFQDELTRVGNGFRHDTSGSARTRLHKPRCPIKQGVPSFELRLGY